MKTCRDVTELVSSSLDRGLPFLQRLGLRMHFLMCKPCALYERQLQTLRTIVGDLGKNEQGPDLPADSARRLQAAIDIESSHS